MTADPDFFDDAYYGLIAPLHPESETRCEVAALREILGLSQDDVILDLGCGWGRHMALLRQAGHRVVGLDVSAPLLRRARNAEEGAPLVAADMRALPFSPGSFDVVMNLATSLGLFLDDRDVASTLREARRLLRPGGRLLLEGMHRDDVVANYADRDRWRLQDGTEVAARRRFDPLRGISHEVLRWRGPAGSGKKRHSLRLRTATELAGLMEAAGLAVSAAYGGWDLERFQHTSDRLILVGGPGISDFIFPGGK
jgi:SAM-dependent methyltransferase